MICTSLQPASLTVGVPTDAVLRVHNTGDVPCITVVLEFEPPRQLILERGRRSLELDHLNPDEYHVHPIRLRAVEAGRCTIAVPNFSFRDATGRAYREDYRTIDVEVHPRAPDPPLASTTERPLQRLAGRPSVFISHRRSESRWFVDRLVDRLSSYFSREEVFVDQAIQPGEDFVVRLDAELQRCAALLALIGPQWSTVVSFTGERRIDSEGDILRHEVAVALGRGVLVIPVLFDGARMPEPADLPDKVRALAERHAKTIDQDHFDADVLKIVFELQRVLEPRT